ncbi:unnamed protein product [Prorocentrum cordatum]|uniref:Uncharacterized protein n=1 Tax=Prorocentrum cordatum TaxID=2364126 RepID=A0ABN9U8J3_9DINO|nr:unnamed protein product [Polarella glacialis]
MMAPQPSLKLSGSIFFSADIGSETLSAPTSPCTSWWTPDGTTHPVLKAAFLASGLDQCGLNSTVDENGQTVWSGNISLFVGLRPSQSGLDERVLSYWTWPISITRVHSSKYTFAVMPLSTFGAHGDGRVTDREFEEMPNGLIEVAGNASVGSRMSFFSSASFDEPSNFTLFKAGEEAYVELKLIDDNFSMKLTKVVLSTESTPNDTDSIVHDFTNETKEVTNGDGKIDFTVILRPCLECFFIVEGENVPNGRRLLSGHGGAMKAFHAFEMTVEFDQKVSVLASMKGAQGEGMIDELTTAMRGHFGKGSGRPIHAVQVWIDPGMEPDALYMRAAIGADNMSSASDVAAKLQRTTITDLIMDAAESVGMQRDHLHADVVEVVAPGDAAHSDWFLVSWQYMVLASLVTVLVFLICVASTLYVKAKRHARESQDANPLIAADCSHARIMDILHSGGCSDDEIDFIMSEQAPATRA